MMKPRYVAFAVAMFVASAAAGAADPIGEFGGETTIKLETCKLTAELAMMKGEGYAPIGACTSEAVASAKKAFPRANAAVLKKKKPVAAQLFKDYYAAWLSAIGSIAPEVDEAKLVYKMRQSKARAKMDEIWNRFQIELL